VATGDSALTQACHFRVCPAVGAFGVSGLAGAGAWPVVSGTAAPAVFGDGFGAGPGAVGAVAADCAAGVAGEGAL
jgi:hypothetical protein